MPQFQGLVNQSPPTAVADGSASIVRLNRRGEIVPAGFDQNKFCADGVYFRATNTTFSTAITLTSATRTTFLATEGAILIRNTSGSATGPTVYLDYIRLIVAGAGTAGTSYHYGIIIDPANRYSSGGTDVTAVNANSGSSTTAVAGIKVGNITLTAASSPRQVGRAIIKTQAAPCLTVGDQIIMTFGDHAGSSMGALNGAATIQMAFNNGPIALGPNNNHSAIVYIWAPAMTAAPTVECEFGWWEI